MTTPHPAKRRRLALGVNKPFRSPFRSPIKTTNDTLPQPQDPAPVLLPSPLATPAELIPAAKRERDEIPDSDHSPSSSPIRSPKPSPTKAALEAEIALLRSHHPLLAKPSRLPELTQKWTQAARTALEVLLAASREQMTETQSSTEKEELQDRVAVLEGMLGSGLDEEGRRLGAEDKAEARMELDVTRARVREAQGGMGGLMASLGIEEGLLGWDAREEEWLD